MQELQGQPRGVLRLQQRRCLCDLVIVIGECADMFPSAAHKRAAFEHGRSGCAKVGTSHFCAPHCGIGRAMWPLPVTVEMNIPGVLLLAHYHSFPF